MNKSHKETISIRFISTAFMILAIAIFKPFGLEVGQWQSYLHLLCLFVLGLFSCFITEVILRYMVHMPRSYERGINYIISRNLHQSQSALSAHQHALSGTVYLFVSPLYDEQSCEE